MAAASAGPYASLHLAPDRYSRQHLTTQFFYRPDALPAAQPTASKHCQKSFKSVNFLTELFKKIKVGRFLGHSVYLTVGYHNSYN